MPKDHFSKLKGSICSIPIETAEINDILHQGVHSNVFLMVKLKQKLNLRGHVFFEAASPDSRYMGLSYLNEINLQHNNIIIDMTGVPSSLTNL